PAPPPPLPAWPRRHWLRVRFLREQPGFRRGPVVGGPGGSEPSGRIPLSGGSAEPGRVPKGESLMCRGPEPLPGGLSPDGTRPLSALPAEAGLPASNTKALSAASGWQHLGSPRSSSSAGLPVQTGREGRATMAQPSRSAAARRLRSRPARRRGRLQSSSDEEPRNCCSQAQSGRARQSHTQGLSLSRRYCSPRRGARASAGSADRLLANR
ncbi:unnamed protein product, partial [Gulo gulo]